MRIIDLDVEVRGILLDIPEITTLSCLDAGARRGEPGHRHRRRHTLIEGTQRDGLPAAA